MEMTRKYRITTAGRCVTNNDITKQYVNSIITVGECYIHNDMTQNVNSTYELYMYFVGKCGMHLYNHHIIRNGQKIIYFSYIMATSFSGGRSRSTRREPPTMGKQLVNSVTCGCESSAPFFVIYKAGRELTPYWRQACTSQKIILACYAANANIFLFVPTMYMYVCCVYPEILEKVRNNFTIV